jgi:glycosyltransferase involved in cell wall biosynthesis
VEGMANSLLEAAACGLPCISAEHISGKELYSDSEVLFVSDPNIEHAFVEPVVNLLSNENLRASMQKAVRKKVEKNYSQKVVFKQLRSFYQNQINLINTKE